MGYSMNLLDYIRAIRIKSGTFRGIREHYDGTFTVVDEAKDKVVQAGLTSRGAALQLAKSLGLNLLRSSEDKNRAGLTRADYCRLFENKKNRSGYKYVVDKLESSGWVELREGQSVFGKFSSVEEALTEAWTHNLNNE